MFADGFLETIPGDGVLEVKETFVRLVEPTKKVVSNLVLAALFGCSLLVQVAPAANAATWEETVEVNGRAELEQAVADAQNVGIAIDVQHKTTKVSAAAEEAEKQRIAKANQDQEKKLRQLITERENQRSEAIKKSLKAAFPKGLVKDVTEMEVNYGTVSLISFKKDTKGIANQKEKHYITEGDSFVYPAAMVNPTTGRKIDVTFTSKAIYKSPEIDETKRVTKGRLCEGVFPECAPGAYGKDLYLDGEFGVFFSDNLTSTWEISFSDSETKEPVKLNSLLSIEDVDFNQKITTPSNAKICLQGNKLSTPTSDAGCGVIGDPGLYAHRDDDHVNHESTVLINVDDSSSYEVTFHVGDTNVAGVVFFFANKGLNYNEPEFSSTEVIYEDLIVEHSSKVPNDYPSYKLPEGKVTPEKTVQVKSAPAALPNTGV